MSQFKVTHRNQLSEKCKLKPERPPPTIIAKINTGKAKIKRLRKTTLTKISSKWDSHVLALGMQKEQPFWKVMCCFFLKLSTHFQITQQSATRYLLKRKENIGSYNDLYPKFTAAILYQLKAGNNPKVHQMNG